MRISKNTVTIRWKPTMLLAVIIALLAVSSARMVAADLTVAALRCEYVENPLGVDVPAPRLFWKLESKTRGQCQSAYQVLAASSAVSDRFFARLHQADTAAADRPASDFLEPGNRWNPLLNSLSTFISGIELDQVSVHDLNNYHDSGENWRVAEGYGALVEAFAAPLDVRLECPATMIDHSGKRLRIETPHGDIRARAAIVAVPTSMIAREILRFSPGLPDKVAAADKLPLGLDDKFFLHIDRPDDLPAETRIFGALDRLTGSYQLRPFGRPVIECYFGGLLAHDLEAEGGDAFARHAIDQIAAHLGNDIRKRLSPIFGSAWGRDPYA